MIDPASAAAVIAAANRAGELLTARLEADPGSPIAADLLILMAAAAGIAADYTQALTTTEQRNEQ
jgi:hypothetical protein